MADKMSIKCVASSLFFSLLHSAELEGGAARPQIIAAPKNGSRLAAFVTVGCELYCLEITWTGKVLSKNWMAGNALSSSLKYLGDDYEFFMIADCSSSGVHPVNLDSVLAYAAMIERDNDLNRATKVIQDSLAKADKRKAKSDLAFLGVTSFIIGCFFTFIYINSMI